MSGAGGEMSALDDLVDGLSGLADTSLGIGEDEHEHLKQLLRAAIREEIRDELGIDEASGP